MTSEFSVTVILKSSAFKLEKLRNVQFLFYKNTLQIITDN